MGKYLRLANLIVSLSILLTACAPAAVPSEAPQEAGSLRCGFYRPCQAGRHGREPGTDRGQGLLFCGPHQ